MRATCYEQSSRSNCVGQKEAVVARIAPPCRRMEDNHPGSTKGLGRKMRIFEKDASTTQCYGRRQLGDAAAPDAVEVRPGLGREGRGKQCAGGRHQGHRPELRDRLGHGDILALALVIDRADRSINPWHHVTLLDVTLP